MSYETDVLEENRRAIQLIDPFNVEEFEDMSESEKREYVAEVSRIYNSRMFQDAIKWLTKQQIEFIGKEAQTWEQVLIGRGNINGIGLVLERLRYLDGVHKDYILEQREKSSKE